MGEAKLVELVERLESTAIELPENPFYEVFKRFGRDELIALVINVAGTAAIDAALDRNVLGPLSNTTKDLIVSTSGPIVEKVGFFPAHFKEAWTEYKSTPKQDRDSLSTYFKSAVKDGSKSLLEDILVHDPLYVGLMYAGLKMYPETPAALLSVSSFLLAVGVVAVGEVAATELLYWTYKRALKRSGFGFDSYYESRFLISKETKAEEVLEVMADKFNLPTKATGHYLDKYFNNTLPSFNGRKPSLRLRKRESEDGGYAQSAQVVYRKANELAERRPEQFRYFPQLKDKLYFPFKGDMPESLEQIDDAKVRRIIKRASDGELLKEVNFTRKVVYDPATLLISADTVYCKDKPFFVVEIKVRKDVALLKKAMGYIMTEFPVLQTTRSKFSIMGASEGSS